MQRDGCGQLPPGTSSLPGTGSRAARLSSPAGRRRSRQLRGWSRTSKPGPSGSGRVVRSQPGLVPVPQSKKAPWLGPELS